MKELILTEKTLYSQCKGSKVELIKELLKI